MAVTYWKIPTVQQFKKDSSIFLADRSKDRVLLMIDRLLVAYPVYLEGNGHSGRIEQQFCLAQLWFNCDYWLKIVDGGKRYPESANMNAGRRPVIYELYKSVVKTLTERTSITANNLPQWLMMTFGRGMGHLAVETDIGGHAIHLCAEDLRWYRLHFMSGLAYQHKWWDNSSELVRADSQNSLMAQNADAKARAEGCSGYVLGMGRDFYLAPHFVSESRRGDRMVKESFYHSSYLGGQQVLCAGTIKIKSGEVQLITNESGHYRPTDSHLLQAVHALSLMGVRMDRLNVRTFGKPVCSGESFLSGRSYLMEPVQDDEAKRELERMKVQARLGGQSRVARAENNRTINDLVKHMREAHDGKRGFKCELCKRYQDRDVMTAALGAMNNAAPLPKR